MRLLLLSMSLMFTTHVMGNCKVFIPEKEFLHDSGYSIRFDFTELLSKKNYKETYIQEEANFEITLRGIERETPRFHHAVGFLEMSDGEGNLYTVQESKLCFTQFCSISDYARAFNKSYKKLGKMIPSCSP